MAEALDSEEVDGLKTAKNRLRDLQVPDVDIVDRPANKRRFLIVKKEDGMSEETTGSEFDTGDIDVDLAADPESGTPPAAAPATPAAPAEAAPAAPVAAEPGAAPAVTATPATATTEPTPEAIAKAEEIKKAAAAHAALLAEKIDAIKKIADEIRTGAGTMDAKELKTKISQLERLGWKIDDPANVINILKAEGAEDADDVAKAIPTPVRDAVVKALREGAERLMSVNVALRGATVTQDKVAAPLPDSVAREIRAIRTLVKSVVQRYPSPTGAAKAEDAAAPEPPEVGYETAHDLMKQAAAITLPAPVRDAVSTKVRGASELLLSIVDAVKKMETTEERLPAPLPAETATAVAKAIGILDEVIEKYPAPAAKSDDVVAALGKHFKAIETLVSGLAGGEAVVKEDPPAPTEDPRIGELMKRVEENAVLLKKVAGEPADSNALADEGRAPVAKGVEGETEWPEDMASEGN